MKFLVSLLLCLFALPCLAPAATLSGKATVDGDPISGVQVMAYPATVLNFSQAADLSSKASLSDGMFSLEVPAGEYYLLAKGDGLYNFYGRNPVTVQDKGMDNVNLLMLPDNLNVPDGASDIETGIAGFVSSNGEPVSGAVAMVYTDLSSNLKGMGLGWVSPSDETGYFEAPLPAGTYYVVIRVRKGGKMAGPLQAGDLFGYLDGNPLVIKEGELSRAHIPLIEVPAKVEQHADSLFGDTHITGRILDSQGSPVAGLQVLLYDDQMMLNRPLYVSLKTDQDGRYQLSFPKGGKYYLAARDELGGTPAPGELYGRYQGSPDHSIKIETGKALENVEIVVDEVY